MHVSAHVPLLKHILELRRTIGVSEAFCNRIVQLQPIIGLYALALVPQLRSVLSPLRLMPIRPGGARRAVSEALRPDHGVWISDDLLAHAFSRYLRKRGHTTKRCLGHVPGPLEHRKHTSQTRRNSISLRADNLQPTLPNIEIATFKWLKRLWDPHGPFKLQWQAPDHGIFPHGASSGKGTFNS